MFIRKKFMLLAVFLTATLALTACGDKVEDFLGDAEKIIVKMEKLAEKKDFSDADYKEYKKLTADFETLGQKQAESLKNAKPTDKQTEKMQDLMQRMMSASMKCEMKKIGQSF